MGRRLFWWELGGFLWIGAAGCVLHFVYEWSGGSVWAAVISAVNESTWEHMKLLFVPMFLYTAVQLVFLGRTYPNLPAVRAVSTLAGLALIPTLFYTYTGVWGEMRDWANIAVFFAAALGAFLLDHRLLRRGALNRKWQQLSGLAVLWGLAFAFVFCTFHPLSLGLWRSPA